MKPDMLVRVPPARVWRLTNAELRDLMAMPRDIVPASLLRAVAAEADARHLLEEDPGGD